MWGAVSSRKEADMRRLEARGERQKKVSNKKRPERGNPLRPLFVISPSRFQIF